MLDPENLRSQIPQKGHGEPLNQKMRQIDRILSAPGLSQHDLSLLALEIENAKASKQRRDEYLRSQF